MSALYPPDHLATRGRLFDDIGRELDHVEAVMSRVPERFAHLPDVRARLKEEIADAIAETRAHLVTALRRAGRL